MCQPELVVSVERDCVEPPVAAYRRLEGWVAREHNEEHHASGPHVGLVAVVHLPREDLRRLVRARAARCAQELAARVERGEAEISHLELEILVEEDILRLDVAVIHPHTVALAQREEQLLEVRARKRLWKGPAGENVVEELASGSELELEQQHFARVAVLARKGHVRDCTLERQHILVLDLLHRRQLAVDHLLLPWRGRIQLDDLESHHLARALPLGKLHRGEVAWQGGGVWVCASGALSVAGPLHR
mmetsp:Transcript_24622/g.50855  ORF Transcript_24622/g.50855 Transcript_24622/m.50855 type:complete len:247 (+) Transcript_24622:1274-2014(+)